MCRVEGSLEARQALVLREQIVPMVGINEGRMAPVIAKSPLCYNTYLRTDEVYVYSDINTNQVKIMAIF